MRFRRPSGDGIDQFQPRLWLILVGLIAMFLYLLAFISLNDEQIEIDFVFFDATVSLIWAMVLMVMFGVLGGVLLSQLYRRRRGGQPRQPPDTVA
ncbi:MAG TPA: hypothetical protein VHH55_09970 [Gaiellaceae bacterium]|nr:hypothetical protein [Gaiellaceae bacterium]